MKPFGQKGSLPGTAEGGNQTTIIWIPIKKKILRRVDTQKCQLPGRRMWLSQVGFLRSGSG